MQPYFANPHREGKRLFARAAPAGFQPGLPEFNAFALRLADNEGAASYIFGSVSFVVRHGNSYSRMKSLLAVFLGVSAATCVAADKAATPSLFTEISGISRDLEQITGLKFSHPVPSAVIDKEHLRKFLESRVNKSIKPDDLKAESLTLKMLGLVPQDFDLRQQTVDLLTEQASAFYDYQKKKLFLLDGDAGEAGLMALAHELGHALADQNFNLKKYIKEDTESDDAATARMAVMEGQATWLMSAYLHMRAGLGPDVPQETVEVVSKSLDQGGEQYPVFSKSPLYIRESLVFPYKGGMLFQDAVYRKMGKASFAEVFRRPPLSTHQIMQPAAYLDKVGPTLPQAIAIPNPKRYRKLAEGTLGEFDIDILCRQYGSEEQAESLDPELQGSQFTLFEEKKEKYPVLAFSTKWSSPEKAGEFMKFYLQVLKKKAKTVDVSNETPDVLAGHDDAGFFRVTRKNEVVECVEGLKSSLN
jgi:hypothetical protein